MTHDESVLLAWLGQEDVSQYGECHGAAFDALYERGFVEFVGTSRPFCACQQNGSGLMYRAVRLTVAGRAALNHEGEK